MKIAVGMSGGIDSSVAAKMLKDAGHEVFGVTMLVWKNSPASKTPSGNSCFSPDKTKDLEAVREICGKLGIACHVVDLSERFESTVLENFRSEYLSGRTPNPCIWCNPIIKFGAMVDALKESGIEFDRFATGHYAGIYQDEPSGRYCVRRAADSVKDQSYFLYRLSQKQLASTVFPLGDYLKSQVREIDFCEGFHGEGQTESQDFYDGDYGDLIGSSSHEGNIVDVSGRVLGKHSGIWHYTIGQRRGLGISSPRPLYVISLDVVRNEVVVGFEEDVFSSVVKAGNIVWGLCGSFEKPVEAFAKIRSVGEPVPALVSFDGRSLVAEFASPVKAATPGQSLVVYDSEGRVLTGGIIHS